MNFRIGTSKVSDTPDIPKCMHETDSVYAQVDRSVFLYSVVLLASVLLLAALFPETMEAAFATPQSGIVTNGSWYYVLVVAVILVSVVVFAFSGYGDIKLGPDHSTPDDGFI